MAVDRAGQDARVSDAPIDHPTDAMVESEPLGDDDEVVENEPSGDAGLGGGEFPDPDTPPSDSAPATGSPERGQGQFDEAYEDAGPDASGSAS